MVFTARREGADGFALPVALKLYSPETYRTAAAYAEDMGRVAGVAARVAAVQHENLVAVHDFTSHAGVRVMHMEWVDGLDLREVLTRETLDRTRRNLTPAHLRFVESVVMTIGLAVVPVWRVSHVVPLSVEYWYVSIDSPPSEAGALNATESVWLPGVIPVIVGAPGVVAVSHWSRWTRYRCPSR